MVEAERMTVGVYGAGGPEVVVLHGGPGAPGGMRLVAEGFADRFRVLEPDQRGRGPVPLSVARHVADLHEILRTGCHRPRPALVGSSWGAMLALAYAAEHPERMGPLVLIGSGTFDVEARKEYRRRIELRIDPRLRSQLAELRGSRLSGDAQLAAEARLLDAVYTVDPIAEDTGLDRVDARAHDETWTDMVRLQGEGVYPSAFRSITSPVLMLHGAQDPHPGRLIRDSLRPFLPQIEYVEWDRCGHYPWRERGIREPFFRVLKDWLGVHVSS
jgi:pimeloyl-ACP methyl ester carboxylesterase